MALQYFNSITKSNQHVTYRRNYSQKTTTTFGPMEMSTESNGIASLTDCILLTCPRYTSRKYIGISLRHPLSCRTRLISNTLIHVGGITWRRPCFIDWNCVLCYRCERCIFLRIGRVFLVLVGPYHIGRGFLVLEICMPVWKESRKEVWGRWKSLGSLTGKHVSSYREVFLGGFPTHKIPKGT